MADTFCILPWKFLWILPHGGPGVCCKYEGQLYDTDGSLLSVYQYSLDQIWNSGDMLTLRRDMAEGRPVPGCRLCYEEEAAQGSSLRTSWNETWLTSHFNESSQTAEQLQAQLMTDGGRAASPGYLYLSVGNLCNLKCRMCDSYSSSRIERDPVHGQWAIEPLWDRRYVAFSQHGHWFRQASIVRDMLLRHPKEVRFLSLAGGETLLIKEIGDLLQYLIDAEAAPRLPWS